MRNIIVLDSNLVISAFLNPKGSASQALEIGIEHFEMAWSKETIEELIDVLKREKFDTYLSKTERAERIQAYAHSIVFFDVTLFVNDCKDQKDNKFLALASTAQARLIVSGDKRDLLSMNPYRGIEIIGVRDFIDNYERYVH